MSEADNTPRPMQFDPEALREASELLQRIPWGDMGPRIFDVERSLRLLLDATGAEWLEWDRERAFYPELPDEFSVSAAQVAAMTPAEKLRYVGRLVYSLGLAYGLPAPSTRGDEYHWYSSGGLLKALDTLLTESLARSRSGRRAFHGSVTRTSRQGDVVPSGHPAVKGREELFEPVKATTA